MKPLNLLDLTRNNIAISLLILASVAIPCHAQYDQEINVEGKYVPEIIEHDRIGIFPKLLKFPVAKSTLSYSLDGVTSDFTPQAVPIQALAWNASHNSVPYRGYLDLSLGSWLESSLSAGYRIINNPQSNLGFRLQHNSTSLWKPQISSVNEDSRAWKYDESIGIYGNHSFGNSGQLDAALDYHLGNFNYYGYCPNLIDAVPVEKVEAPSQTLNDVAARLEWHSPAKSDNISWYAGARFRYFGYCRMYAPTDKSLSPLSLTGTRETHTEIMAGVKFPTSSSSLLGIDINTNFLGYNSCKESNNNLQIDAYSLTTLSPYYRFTRNRFDIQLGANLDLAFNAGPQNDRYGTFHIAPNVRIGLNSGPIAIYLNATGGSLLHSLASNYDIDYYQIPAILSTTPIYTPLDARIGANFGLFSGFYAGLELAYRTSHGQYTGGWYQQFLNNSTNIIDGYLPTEIPDGSIFRPVAYNFTPNRYNLSGFSFGVNLGYDTGKFFRVDAKTNYQSQDGKTGWFNGYDRPEWTVNIQAESNPWNTLKLRVGYSLRALRTMPVTAHFADTNPLNGQFLISSRLPNSAMLNFGASYGLTDNMDIWIQADNLLCRKNILIPGLPEPRLRLLAGFGWKF